MALGMDSSLPGSSRSALRPPQPKPPQKQSTAQPQGFRVPGISEDVVGDAVNNQLASGYGARESAMSSMDRAGVSRGRGQNYYANIAQEAADAQGQAAAAKTISSAVDANNRAQYAYENMQKNEDLNTQGLLENLRHSSVMERQARQGWGQDMYETDRRGRFGLDQMQLDINPLLRKLFTS